MCGLCGILGGKGHWTDSASNPGAFGERAETHTRRRERQERVRLANEVLDFHGLTLSDWAGTSYVLRSRTGQTVLLDNLSELWRAAARLSRRPCDPLDPALLAALRERRRPRSVAP